MTHLGAFLALAFAAAAGLLLAGVGSVASAYNEKGRQILRGLRNVLQGELEAYLIDYGHGRGIGFNFAAMTMAVAWRAGEWCLVYRLEELLGVELIVDDWATGWAFAKDHLKTADPLAGAKERIGLRLVFADPQYADFELELWSAELAGDSTAPDAAEAIELGDRWLAELHRLLNPKPLAAAVRAEPAPASRGMPSFRTLADS
jgi:hypothetical protein